MSLYSRYADEHLGWKTIEVDDGFITYALQPPEASIEAFYVKPEARGTLLAKSLADQVFKIAADHGCTVMWAKIQPGTGGAEHAMRTNLHYGFKIAGTRGNDIILMKKIGG